MYARLMLWEIRVDSCGRVVVKFSLLVEKAVSCMIYNAVNSEEASAETMFSLSESESVKQKLKAFSSDKNENKLTQ